MDAASYSLPYDYYFVAAVARHFFVDVFVSSSVYNEHYINLMRRLQNVRVYEWDVSRRRGLFGALAYLRLWFSVLRRRGAYQAINIQWPTVTPLDWLLILLIINKSVLTLHNPAPHNYSGKRFWLFRIYARLATKLVFVSQWSADAFARLYSTRGSQATVLQHGMLPLMGESVDGGSFACNTQPRRELVFFGKIEPYKGVDFFLELLREGPLPGRPPRVIGKWNPSLSELKAQLVSVCDIRDEYCDPDELLRIFQERPIFVLPYQQASQSGILYNLVYYRQAFVATDVGDIGVFLKSAGLGRLLFDRSDIHSFWRAVDYVIDDWTGVCEKVQAVSADSLRWQYSRSELEQALGLVS